MSKTINKLNAISVILMALLTHDATAASSYAEDQAQSMSGRAAMRGGSVASNNAQLQQRTEQLIHNLKVLNKLKVIKLLP